MKILPKYAKRSPQKRVAFLPLVVLSVVALGTVLFYHVLKSREEFYTRSTIAEEMIKIKTLLNNETNLRLLAVKRMAQRWEAGHGTPYNVWQQDAINYMSRRTSVKAVEWADSTYHVRWVEPMKGNENAIGLDIRFDQARKAALNGAAENDSTVLTPPLDLVQGYKAFIAYSAIHYDDKFDGFIVSIININEHFTDLLQSELDDKYSITLEQNGKTFFDLPQAALMASGFATTDTLTIAGNAWNLRIVPTQKMINAQVSKLPEATLFGGLCIALLSYLSVRFMLLSRSRLRALKESETLYRMIIDGVDDYAIFMLTPEGNIKSWNRGAESIKGYREQEVLGKHFSLFYTPEDKANDLPDHILLSAMEHGKYTGEGLRVRKNGEVFWANILIEPLYDTDNGLVGFVKVARDITERRTLEERTEHLAKSEQKRLSDIVSIQHEIAHSHHDIQGAMELITERTRMLVGADSGIIEMLDGTDMVYRAASGPAKQYLGLRLPVAASLSGTAVRENRTLKCDDSQIDTRVNKEACRKTGAISMVVVPLMRQKEVVGVLKVLSNKPHTFNDQHVETLKLMAGVLSAALSDAMVNEFLRQSEETFRSMMEYATVGMALVAPSGKWLVVNKSLCQMLGYTANELRNKDFQSITHPEDLERDLGNVKKILAKEVTSYQIEKRYLHKNGNIVWVHLGVSLVWDKDEQPKYFVAQIQDITKRKQLEEIQQNQAALLDLAHDAIFVRNSKDEIVFWNRGAEALYGWTSEEVLGHVTHSILKTTFPKPLEEIMAEMNENKQWQGELTHIHKNGKKIIVASSWAIQPDKNGNPIGTLEINRDVTEREVLVQKLLSSNTELERFAFVASHDLQEPIRMITNFSNIMATDYADKVDDEGKEYLNIMHEAGIRMLSTVEDLLNYSRVENELTKFKSFSGEEALESSIENLKMLIDDKHAVVTNDPLPELYGNPVQIIRILQNFIANAIKYQPTGNKPRIHISATDEGDEWRIWVQDNGLGIADEFLDQIFQPFKRLHTWEAIKGTGLGLAICKKIIENHQGKLWVTSELGKGSVFLFTLPKNTVQQHEDV